MKKQEVIIIVGRNGEGKTKCLVDFFNEIKKVKTKLSCILLDTYDLSLSREELLELKMSASQYKISKLIEYSKKFDILLLDDVETYLEIEKQKTIISDLIQNCKYVVATTHSPFIFDNEYSQYTVGLEKIQNKLIEMFKNS